MELCVMRYTWAALCVLLLVISGSVKSEEAMTVSVTYELTVDITNRIYNDSLLKTDSPDFKKLYSQVNETLYSIYGCESCKTHLSYQKVSAMTFSDQNGNVLVKASLVFQSNQTTAGEIKDLFLKAIDTEKTTGLKFNPDFTQVVLSPTSVPTVTKTPTIHSTTEHHNAASSSNTRHAVSSPTPVPTVTKTPTIHSTTEHHKASSNPRPVSVKPEDTSPPATSVTYVLTMDITNHIYNDSLLNSHSPYYEMMYSRLNDTLNSIYGCESCKTHLSYQKGSAMTFSDQNGTALVNASLVFQSDQTTAGEIKDLFLKAIDTEKTTGLKFNPDFTQVVLSPTPVPTVTKTPTIHHNAASSFNHRPSLSSFLRHCASFCLLILISCFY